MPDSNAPGVLRRKRLPAPDEDRGTARDPGPAGLLARRADQILVYRDRFDATRDTRAVFAFVYERLTRELAARLENDANEFDDPGWIAALADSFAARYIGAMDAIDQAIGADTEGDPGGAVPEPWLDVHRAISDGGSYVLEDLVFSMMAHISFDLPHALLEVGMEHEGRSRVADYHRMNDVLGLKTDDMQVVVARRYQRFLAVLDRLAGHYDEFFTNYGIRLARSVAWYNAHRLLDPPSAQAATAAIGRSTGAFIKFVRYPSNGWLRILLRVVRAVVPRRRRWPPS